MTGPCTVRKYFLVLSHELTRHDMRESAREAKRGRVNIYRLGLLFEAMHKAEEDCKGILDSDSEQSKADLKMALYNRFERDFPPIKKVIKQLDAGVCKIK